MRIQKERANAKINLYLDVTEKRADGFHELKSVMQAISLFDVVTVKYLPSKETRIKLTVKGRYRLAADNKNLAYRAAALYLERASLAADIEIILEKNIPIAAGLAGGSTDAAAVLRAMNKIFGRLFAERALLKLAAELGSDVPFCLTGRTALCEGRGERLTKLSSIPPLYIVVAVSDEHVSTPAAYKLLDDRFSSFDGSVETGSADRLRSMLSDIKRTRLASKSLFNVFEEVILPTCSKAAEIKARLVALGAEIALMSGSGPSVFGLFTDFASAERAARNLCAGGIEAYYAQSVNR